MLASCFRAARHSDLHFLSKKERPYLVYPTPMPFASHHRGGYGSTARKPFVIMHEPTESIVVVVLQESLRLLQMCSLKGSLMQMREICTDGPESTLLKTCLSYIEHEWPGENQSAGFFRDFHALPTDELAAIRERVIECCRNFREPSIQ